MTMRNTDLDEKPNHGHYAACRNKMAIIDRYYKRCFLFTAAISLLLIILTWMTFRFSIISVFPNIVGDRTDLSANLVQTLIILVLPVLDLLACGKYKIFNVILLFIYGAMFFTSGFSKNASDIFSFLAGAVGGFSHIKAINRFLDYRQLSHTEGFPFFDELLQSREDNSEYVSDYGKKTPSAVMDSPDPVPLPQAEEVPPEETQNEKSEKKVTMDEI